jgi:AcrR family transcriptional regulator
MTEGGPKLTRREEYAQATRRAIVDAARRLFAERGYFATRVEDIAAAARVAPATVYAVTGGKQGLLHVLMESWWADPIVPSTLSAIAGAEDPEHLIRQVADAGGEVRERFADVMRLLVTTAPHDPEVARHLQAATARYREGLARVAARLAELNALRADIDSDHALDVLWFYFGYWAWFTLHDDNGWSYADAGRWLADQVCEALLGRRAPGGHPSRATGRRRPGRDAAP